MTVEEMLHIFTLFWGAFWAIMICRSFYVHLMYSKALDRCRAMKPLDALAALKDLGLRINNGKLRFREDMDLTKWRFKDFFPNIPEA